MKRTNPANVGNSAGPSARIGMWAATVVALVIGAAFGATGTATAEKGDAQALPAQTIFVDISIASRKKRAAAKMTDLHAEMAQKGYEVIDVEPYTENGDLQGFYVTYVAMK